MKTLKTYSDVAQYLGKVKEIKVTTHYGNDRDPNWVYIPRIYHNEYRKAKVRVLTLEDNVKNCLKITWNPDRYTKKDIERIVNNNTLMIKYRLHGSCQNHLTCNNLLQVLTGCVKSNNQMTELAENLIHKTVEI